MKKLGNTRKNHLGLDSAISKNRKKKLLFNLTIIGGIGLFALFIYLTMWSTQYAPYQEPPSWMTETLWDNLFKENWYYISTTSNAYYGSIATYLISYILFYALFSVIIVLIFFRGIYGKPKENYEGIYKELKNSGNVDIDNILYKEYKYKQKNLYNKFKEEKAKLEIRYGIKL